MMSSTMSACDQIDGILVNQYLTFTGIDRHSGHSKNSRWTGILAFAERVLPRASDL
jgi:hypothetical protein